MMVDWQIQHGRTVNFKNTVIIMTSNIGARLITDKKLLGFSNENKENNVEKDYETINIDYESNNNKLLII